MLIPSKRQRRIYVEMAPRYISSGVSVWGSWVNITPWFLEQESDITYDVDDETFEGRIEQQSIRLKFNDLRGNFRQHDVDSNVLWGSGYKIYHSRIRYYDWVPDEDSAEYGVKPSIDPMIDGLIAGEIDYSIRDNTAVITVASKLDILRDHYLFDDYKGRVRTATSQSIISKVISIFNDIYPSLGVTTYGGVVRNSVLYTDMTPYGKNMLELLYDVVQQGGGVGGLSGNDIFFTYFDFDTQNGVDTITQSNFTSDGSTILLYQYDATDYGGGSGTTLDDKSGNGYDAVIPSSVTGISNVWRTDGFFGNYKARHFYYLNDNGAGGVNFSLTDFTLEAVLNIDSFNVAVTASARIIVAPLFVFCECGTADVACFSSTSSGDKYCGLHVSNKGELLWVSASSGLEDYLPVRSRVVIDELPGEGQTFYITLTYDSSTQIYKYYLDGVLRATFSDFHGYSVAELSDVNKILARGYTVQPVGSGYLGESIEMYVSGFRLSSSVRTASDIYSTYLKVYGQSYNIYSLFTTIDNYSNNNLLRVDSYSTGQDQVKNYIIYEENTSDRGIFEFSYDTTKTLGLTILINGKEQYAYEFGSYGEMMDYLNWSDESNPTALAYATELRDTYGFTAELGSGVGSNTVSAIFKVSGKEDYRNFNLDLYDVGVSSAIGVEADPDKYFTATTISGVWTIAMFSPADVNNNIVAKDENSIASYGLKIYQVKNYELINSTLDKTLLTTNQLASRLQPYRRVTIRVPYKTVQADIFRKVKLSITKENTAQIPHFSQEGGQLTSWEENGNYRQKDFFVVGIRHNKEGHYTQLRLREAESTDILAYSPVLWLDAKAESTIIYDTSTKVSKWLDRSGNGKHVTQSSASSQPVYEAGGQYVDFPGSDDYLVNSSFSYFPKTVFIVAKYYGPEYGNRCFAGGQSTPDSGLNGYYLYAGKAGVAKPGHTVDYSSVSASQQSTTNILNTKVLLTYTFNSDTKSVAVSVNQETPASGTAGEGTTDTLTGLMRIGGAYWDGAQSDNANFNLHELIWFDELLTDDQISEIEAYLIDKWDVTI